MIKPHLLPLSHPAKPILDEIFSKSGILYNERSLQNAGFSIISIQPKSALVVARHPELPHFVLKMYRSSRPNGRNNTPGWQCLAERCLHAKKVQAVIHRNHIRHFVVPDKYLYVLPPFSKKHYLPVVLLATDMQIEGTEKTKTSWQTAITPRHLEELFIVLQAGYGSSYLVNNMPFTKEGKIAIIDIEKPKRSFDLKRVEKYFSEDMKPYWRKLID